METLGDDHLARTAEWVSASFEERMDTSGLDEVRIRAERHHWEWRKALFLDELERRAAGGKVRRPERTLKERRADRVPCSNGCGARVHAGGSGLCYRCAVRAAREAA